MAITLAQAEAHLATWLAAETAVATGQEYEIGNRRLVRADLSEIAERITFWERRVDALSSDRGAGIVTRRAVPH